MTIPLGLIGFVLFILPGPDPQFVPYPILSSLGSLLGGFSVPAAYMGWTAYNRYDDTQLLKTETEFWKRLKEWGIEVPPDEKSFAFRDAWLKAILTRSDYADVLETAPPSLVKREAERIRQRLYELQALVNRKSPPPPRP